MDKAQVIFTIIQLSELLENYNAHLIPGRLGVIIQLSELLENYNNSVADLLEKSIIQLSELLENYNLLHRPDS